MKVFFVHLIPRWNGNGLPAWFDEGESKRERETLAFGKHLDKRRVKRLELFGHQRYDFQFHQFTQDLVRRVGKVIPVCYRFYDSRTIFSRDLPRESKATTYNPPRSARPTPVAKLGWASCVNSHSEASEVPQMRLGILLTPFFISYPKLPQRWWVSSGKAQGGRGEGAIVGGFDILTFAAFEDDKNRVSSWPRTEKKMWQDSGLTLFLT